MQKEKNNSTYIYIHKANEIKVTYGLIETLPFTLSMKSGFMMLLLWTLKYHPFDIIMSA